MSEQLLPGVTPHRSKAARLEEFLPKIEAALAGGHTHAAILDYLNKMEGFDLSPRYYELTLHRIRKRRRATDNNSAKAPKKLGPIVGTTRDNSSGHELADTRKKFTYDLHSPLNDFFTPKD